MGDETAQSCSTTFFLARFAVAWKENIGNVVGNTDSATDELGNSGCDISIVAFEKWGK